MNKSRSRDDGDDEPAGSSNFQPSRNKAEVARQNKLKREAKEREKEELTQKKRSKTRLEQRSLGPLHNPADQAKPLILYKTSNPREVEVVVDGRLSDDLLRHQRDGITKMYGVLSNFGGRQHNLGQGFILADSMGLGKTVQTISVIWTLLTQSPRWDPVQKHPMPEIKKVIIVSPKSVVPVWGDQFKRWLLPSRKAGPTNQTPSIEILDDKKNSEKKRECALKFMQPSDPTQILILSYETFVSLTKDTQKGNALNNPLRAGPLVQNTGKVVDLIVLDEAHYIKNKETQRCEAILEFEVSRKIVLTGTPLQNNLLEYHTLIDYVQPNVLPEENDFKSLYEAPILKFVENKRYLKGKIKLETLQTRTAPFFLRRANNPFVNVSKTEYVVCCKITVEGEAKDAENIQFTLHNAFVEALKRATENNVNGRRKKEKTINAFQAISFLKDLCGHPQLVYDKCIQWKKNGPANLSHLIDIFESKHVIQEKDADLEIALSAKLRVLKNLLLHIKNNKDSNDRVVIVSYYTHILDLIEKMCRKQKFIFKRFDGKVSGKNREKLIEGFNDPHAKDQFIMTLSSRAGGCGISLTGANHLIMFDPDWNPANDDQAMSRIYREGQKKDCHIYRFLTTATIEEQIFHRQIVKKLLAGAVLNDGDETSIFSFDDVPLHQDEKGNLALSYLDEMTDEESVFKELFNKITANDLETCITHVKMLCSRCDVDGRNQLTRPRTNDVIDHPDALELHLWNHHFDKSTLPDDCEALYDAWPDDDDISFVFRRKWRGEKELDASMEA